MPAFRPHHFLCAFCFQGKGYSEEFIANFSAIMAELNTDHGDDTPITISPHTDDICAPCPHRTGTTCHSEPKINQLDAAHLTALGLEGLESITWGEAKQRIKSHLTLEKFNKICSPCEWKASGICESVLQTSGIK